MLPVGVANVAFAEHNLAFSKCDVPFTKCEILFGEQITPLGEHKGAIRERALIFAAVALIIRTVAHPKGIKIMLTVAQIVAELDRIGAAASSCELWRLWASAPDSTTEEAHHLFKFLTTNQN